MKIHPFLLLALMIFFYGITNGQSSSPKPYGVLPTESQLRWQEMDMYVLVHFTPTTFEDKEWGFGDADPKIFNPSRFDAGQIINAVKTGGFKGLILVAKHHDGFCLWPTSTTNYNISKSPWKNGKGDMVKEFETACRKAGLKFGVYCSPWDRNNPAYGTAAYVDIYRKQLHELYTNYGPLFISWHDGANGGDGFYGGARESRRIDRSVYYGWDTTWTMTRELQPGAVIFSDVGPDIRWVGNENGEAAGETWATFTPVPIAGKTRVGPGEIEYGNSPSGTRNGQYWMPAECDVPLRNGWFFHEKENIKVKSPDALFQIYLKSVGRSGCLDLGIAPDKRGMLHENDVASLKSFGELIEQTFKQNLAGNAKITASNTRNGDHQLYGVSQLTDPDRYTYWCTDDSVHRSQVLLEWPANMKFDLIRLRENIKLGQRIDSVLAESWSGDHWSFLSIIKGIGGSRIIYFPEPVIAQKLRLTIYSPVAPALSDLGIFRKAGN